MSRVSIKMIAQTLGVSNATVSLVLNGKEKEGRVGKELAEKIRIILTTLIRHIRLLNLFCLKDVERQLSLHIRILCSTLPSVWKDIQKL